MSTPNEPSRFTKIAIVVLMLVAFVMVLAVVPEPSKANQNRQQTSPALMCP